MGGDAGRAGGVGSCRLITEVGLSLFSLPVSVSLSVSLSVCVCVIDQGDTMAAGRTRSTRKLRAWIVEQVRCCAREAACPQPEWDMLIVQHERRGSARIGRMLPMLCLCVLFLRVRDDLTAGETSPIQ